jgi:hypothetical protein
VTSKTGTANKLSLLRGKKPRETTHAVVLDHEAVEAYAQARQRLSAAQGEQRKARRLNEPDETMNELQAAVDEAQAEVDELLPAADEGVGVVSVTIRAMAPLAYAALKAEFPPTDEDHKRVRLAFGDEKAKAAWNRDEFGPRLVAHCVVDPETTLEDARAYFEAWTAPEWNMLVGACVAVHESAVDTASLGNSFGRTRS